LFVAGVVLQVMFWNIIMRLAEASLSMEHCCRRVDTCFSLLHLAVRLLVYGNLIVRDIFVSAFIFLTLMPWVIINAINDVCLPRFSIHQTLIYRTPGPLAQKQISHDSSSDEEVAAGSAAA